MAPEVVSLENELPAVCEPAPLHVYQPASGYFIFTPNPDWKAYFLTAPPHGFEIFKRERHIYSYGHHHPDTGNILLNYRGRWALADTGYTFCKASSEHNVLLFNGHGQHNDTYVWMPPPPWDIKTELAEIAEHPWGVLANCKLSSYYPNKLGLKKWNRSLYGLKDGAMIVVDEMEAEQPGIFTISWGSDFVWQTTPDGFANEGGIRLIIQKNDVKFEMDEIIPAKRFYDTPPKWHALRISSPAPEVSRRFISVLAPVDMDIDINNLSSVLQL